MRNFNPFVEKIKTALIFLLLGLLFINLFAFFYSSFYSKNGSSINTGSYDKSMAFLLLPSSIEYRKQSEGFMFQSSSDDANAAKLLSSFADILASGDLYIIGLEKPLEDSAPNYLKISLGVSLPAKDMAQIIKGELNLSLSNAAAELGKIDFVAFDKSNPNSPIISSDNKLYRLTSPSYQHAKAIDEMISESIESAVLASSIRYSTESKLNDTAFVPVRGYLAPPIYNLSFETSLPDTKTYGKIVDGVFGAEAQFVKEGKTQEGDLLYVYGYGDTTLRIGDMGVLEYKKKSERVVKNTASIASLLSAALAFEGSIFKDQEELRLIGVFESTSESDALEYNPTIGQALENGTVSFLFQRAFGGGKLSTLGSAGFMRIDVGAAGVTYYYRFLPSTVQPPLPKSYKGIKFESETIKSILLKKAILESIEIEYIKANGAGNLPQNSEKKQGALLDSVKRVEIAYYENGLFELRPALIVWLDKEMLIIDYYTGELS